MRRSVQVGDTVVPLNEPPKLGARWKRGRVAAIQGDAFIVQWEDARSESFLMKEIGRKIQRLIVEDRRRGRD